MKSIWKSLQDLRINPVVDAILFCPPFIMTEEETVQLARIFIQALGAVLDTRK